MLKTMPGSLFMGGGGTLPRDFEHEGRGGDTHTHTKNDREMKMGHNVEG
mgnify:CR=1 FL=1